MSAYRNEREALLHRVSALERALQEARGDKSREEIQRELGELREQVSAAAAEMDADRAALSELNASLARLQSKLTPEPAVTAKPAQGDTSEATARRRQSLIFTATGVVALAVAGLVVVASGGEEKEEAAEVAVAALAIPGGPHAVDPIAALAVARSGVSEPLVEIKAVHVGSDGLVDLDAGSYRGSLEYTFARHIPGEPEDKSVPVGAREPSVEMTETINVEITAEGVDRSGLPMPAMPFGVSAPVPDPKCTFKRIWDHARARGAPADAVATIRYSEGVFVSPGAEPAVDAPGWYFEIPGTDVDFEMSDAACVAEEPAPAL